MSTSSDKEIARLIEQGADATSAKEIVAVVDAITVQASRLFYNEGRVQHLVKVASSEVLPRATSDDLLRAAIVLLHASLEDFLRTVARAYLRFASPAVINEVPLLGLGPDRPEKFMLGALVAHQQLNVRELIDKSIERYLERATFSNSREIATLLTQLEVELPPVRGFFAALDELASRRHKIVHRCDFDNDQLRYGEHQLTPIAASDVLDWSKSVTDFATLIMKQLAMTNIRRFAAKKALQKDVEMAGGDDATTEDVG